jgi:hypothetical protein
LTKNSYKDNHMRLPENLCEHHNNTISILSPYVANLANCLGLPNFCMAKNYF